MDLLKSFKTIYITHGQLDKMWGIWSDIQDAHTLTSAHLPISIPSNSFTVPAATSLTENIFPEPELPVVHVFNLQYLPLVGLKSA